MQYSAKQLPKSQVEITVTLTPADYKKDMEMGAARLSERATIHGFRAGKAPYDIVKKQLGEVKILEEAMQTIVEKNFFKAVTEEKLETVGMPEIVLEKMAPGNDFVFKATVALLPTIKLPDISTIKAERKPAQAEDKDVDNVLKDLTKMQGKEIAKAGPATKEDKVMISMNLSIDKVPVEGGQADSHQVYLNEEHYIPGFAEQLIGLKKDDKKQFSLKFPEDHYQKHIAGKNVDIDVMIKDVFEIEYPKLDDEFAKKVGQTDIKTLRELLSHNLTHEALHKEEQRLEGEILDKMVQATTFTEIPDVLIRSEKQKMFNELKHDLEKNHIEMDKYLADLKKTEEEIYADFTDRSTTRVKAALISRQVALDNNIKVDQKDVEKEIANIRAAYPGDEKVEEALKRHEVVETLSLTIQNRKVVEYLKEKIAGKTPEHDHEEKK
ncbi:MAG: trigger factor [bacterium]|nr:trigger factor [bacterium]